MEDWAKAKNIDIEISREPNTQKLQAAIESKQFPAPGLPGRGARTP
jgi:hypothetical protein